MTPILIPVNTGGTGTVTAEQFGGMLLVLAMVLIWWAFSVWVSFRLEDTFPRIGAISWFFLIGMLLPLISFGLIFAF